MLILELEFDARSPLVRNFRHMQKLSTFPAGLFLVLSLIPQSSWTQDSWTFDGAKLGEGFRDEFVRHMTLVPPCDVDSINEGTRSVAFFTAKPCRGEGMTEHTTVVVFTSPALSSQTPNAAVDSLAWMGGTYLNSRSDFPIQVGTTENEAVRVLGPVSEEVTFRKNNFELKIEKHSGSVYSLVARNRVVGFVVGNMPALTPEDEEHEEWRAIEAAWFQFTLPALPPTQPEEPGQPGNPSNPNPPSPVPVPIGDPMALERAQTFMDILSQPGSDTARFRALAPLIHSSLIRKDGTDFAPGIREYAYRRALKNAPFYVNPISVEKVQQGEWTVIGSGPTAEAGRVDKYFITRRLEAGGGSAPLHFFFPKSGATPVIFNFGSL